MGLSGMSLKSVLIGMVAIVLIGAGAAWSVGSKPENWAWMLAPKQAGYVPDPKDINFYYPLPEVVEFTSPYGWRTHPIYGDRRLHAGVDLGAPEGMPVLSAHSGYVRYAAHESGYGNLVIVEYADGKYQTYYAHLSEILVKEGDAVRPRQVIGLVGSTGGVTGPHLHFELRRKDDGEFVAIDPMSQVKAVESYVAVRPVETASAQSSPSASKSESAAQSPAQVSTSAPPSTQPFTASGLASSDSVSLTFDPDRFQP
jgi:murein DD-endopeptidase MepM/ murein hydrolase activator NlpD